MDDMPFFLAQTDEQTEGQRNMQLSEVHMFVCPYVCQFNNVLDIYILSKSKPIPSLLMNN